jgi:hypothetical protein
MSVERPSHSVDLCHDVSSLELSTRMISLRIALSLISLPTTVPSLALNQKLLLCTLGNLRILLLEVTVNVSDRVNYMVDAALNFSIAAISPSPWSVLWSRQ